KRSSKVILTVAKFKKSSQILFCSANHGSVTLAECATKCNTETLFTCRTFMYDENDSECWTAAANSKTENIMRRRNTALYEKNEYLLECANGIGTDYRGTKSRTKSEQVCQRWDASYPHRPKYVFN
uniref:Kringle domain-containing protein n=1 Tax=Haplochromis burtoni TaxID=8153 RepID=A0A3Q2VMX2_HAPBU